MRDMFAGRFYLGLMEAAGSSDLFMSPSCESCSLSKRTGHSAAISATAPLQVSRGCECQLEKNKMHYSGTEQ